MPELNAKTTCDKKSEISSVALYRTEGSRKRKHLVVLYLGADRDWTEIQRSRNGNKMWGLLATAKETSAAREYREASHRACSLTYSGKTPADLDGLKQDLETFGFDPASISRLVDAARPCFANLKAKSPNR